MQTNQVWTYAMPLGSVLKMAIWMLSGPRLNVFALFWPNEPSQPNYKCEHTLRYQMFHKINESLDNVHKLVPEVNEPKFCQHLSGLKRQRVRVELWSESLHGRDVGFCGLQSRELNSWGGGDGSSLVCRHGDITFPMVLSLEKPSSSGPISLSPVCSVSAPVRFALHFVSRHTQVWNWG